MTGPSRRRVLRPYPHPPMGRLHESGKPVRTAANKAKTREGRECVSAGEGGQLNSEPSMGTYKQHGLTSPWTVSHSSSRLDPKKMV